MSNSYLCHSDDRREQESLFLWDCW